MIPCIPPPPPSRDTSPCPPPESGEWAISPARRAALLSEWREAERHDTTPSPAPMETDP